MLLADTIRPLPELLRRGADRHGDRPALSDSARRVGHRELEERTRRLGGRLRAAGVRDGDVVLLLLPTGVALVEGYLAAVRAHAVAACVTVVTTADELAFTLADCHPRVVLTDRRREPLLAAAVAATGRPAPVALLVDDPVDHRVGAQDLPGPGDPPDDLGLDEPAFLLYTSGTTGRPKGVLLTQRGLLWVAAAAWQPVLGLTAADRLLVPLPLSHSYPLDLTLAALTVGASVHLPERFSPTGTAAQLADEPTTVLVGVPTTFGYLLEAGVGPGPRLRLGVSAGALLSPALRARAERRLGVPVVDAYGATETSTVVAMTAPGGGSPPGSCGLPPPGVAVRVLDPATDRDVDPGGEGELTVRGPGIMIGYLDRPDETAAALRAGWYRTGDLARQDRNGFLTITGRVKDIIVRGGENIAPAEIERIAAEHPDVADCAVAARPDRLLGEVPVLYLVGRADAPPDPEALLAWCGERLPPFKVPAAAHVLAAIPRTPSGKVRRHLLGPPTLLEEHP